VSKHGSIKHIDLNISAIACKFNNAGGAGGGPEKKIRQKQQMITLPDENEEQSAT